LRVFSLSTSSNAVYNQINYHVSSSTNTGSIGFGIRSNYYSSVNKILFGTEYQISSNEYKVYYTGSNPGFPGHPGMVEHNEYLLKETTNKQVTQRRAGSFKEFTFDDANFERRTYIMSGSMTSSGSIYLYVEDIPKVQYIEMNDQESWAFTIRVIGRRLDELESVAYFINGYCDNYGTGTIVGSSNLISEIGSQGVAPPNNAVTNWNVDVIYDTNGGSNNWLRVEAQNASGYGVSSGIKWRAYVDIIVIDGRSTQRETGTVSP